MAKTCVGVLRGGPSSEYEVSLKTGQTVLSALPAEKYDVRDIFIDKHGAWHVRGRPVEPARAIEQVDVVFNGLHGSYGEDGTVQRLLSTFGVPYTGSDALGSAIGMNKPLAKSRVSGLSFRCAPHRVLDREVMEGAAQSELWRTFPQPSVVKPASGGSSVATSVVRSYSELVSAIAHAFDQGDQVLIEQYLRGREATVAVAEGFRGEDVYAFPVIEIIPNSGTFFDYDNKYNGGAREVCPAPFPYETAQALMTAAREVHRALGLRDYSRSDFIIQKDGIYFLEVNTLPGLTPASLVPKSVEAVGATLPQFLDHLVMRALARG
jgi:D-alanine-D-alanine ligase